MAETNDMSTALHKTSPSTGKSISSHPSIYLHQRNLPAPELGTIYRRPGNFTSAQTTSQKTHKSSRRPRLVTEDVADGSTSDLDASRQHHIRRGQTSITHLMNFSMPPLSESYSYATPSGVRTGNTPKASFSRHHSDKLRYIHANYRFIVNPNGNYEMQVVDANQPLDWNDILQILASKQFQNASCPICLSLPVAPRIAKCGHIFCLPCFIRYVQTTQEDVPIPEKRARWKRCPICWEMVYMSETKPVRWYIGQESPPPHEGDEIFLRLIVRKPGNTLALPRDASEEPCKSGDLPWYSSTEAMEYARIIKGSKEYMIQQYNIEIEELDRLGHEDELIYAEEPTWTKKAVISIHETMEAFRDIAETPATTKELHQTNLKNQTNNQTKEKQVLTQRRFNSSNIDSDEDNKCDSHNIRHEKNQDFIPKCQRSSQNEQSHTNPLYFFYQALPHYYLAPLDIRILKTAFGSFESFPPALLPRVERIITEHMHNDLRKRTKYLSHLPNGCELKFIECNWTNVIPEEILEKFKEEIAHRRKRNFEKQKREERNRIFAEKAEKEERWAVLGTRPNYESEALTDQDFCPLTTVSVHPNNQSSNLLAPHGVPGAIPASLSLNSDSALTVWGTPSVRVPSEENTTRLSDQNDDGWLNSWDVEDFAENELIAKAENLSLVEHDTNSRQSCRKFQSKKKKPKKITLMSTTARRTA